MKFVILLYLLGIQKISASIQDDVEFSRNQNEIEVSDSWENVFEYLLQNIKSPFSPTEFVSSFGYPIEVHHVITEDKFNLTVHRIPHGKNKTSEPRPPVFFMHGIVCTSAEFLKVGPNRSLAFKLADAGYDVWLGNNRANTYSPQNLQYNKSDSRYSDYSFEELGTKDLTAMVDYVLNKTARDKLTFIGHSQGTTDVFVLLAEKPEYNKKFNLVNALAPIAFMSNLSSPVIRFIVKNIGIIESVLKILQIDQIFTHNNVIFLAVGVLCHPDLHFELCPTVLSALAGKSPDELDRAYLPLFFETFPAGSSVKSFSHYAQEVQSGYFRKYDFGTVKNLVKYRRLTPPDYNLSNIKAPVALFYGKSDGFVAVEDVEKFAQKLPAQTLVHKQLIKSEYFSHLDFLSAIHLNELVNNDVISLTNKYNGRDPVVPTSEASVGVQSI